MHTLSNGYLQPDNTDTGDVVFPAMNQNIQQLNDHNHDGLNSNLVNHKTQNILSGGWGAIGGGMYSQNVVMPAGFLYDERIILLRLSTGEPIYPMIARINATTYSVEVNDNTINLIAYYG